MGNGHPVEWFTLHLHLHLPLEQRPGKAEHGLGGGGGERPDDVDGVAVDELHGDRVELLEVVVHVLLVGAATEALHSYGLQ